MKNQKTF